jgi:hypothetical protein
MRSLCCRQEDYCCIDTGSSRRRYILVDSKGIEHVAAEGEKSSSYEKSPLLCTPNPSFAENIPLVTCMLGVDIDAWKTEVAKLAGCTAVR